MKFKQNAEESKQRFIKYWNRENHDRPVLGMAAVNEAVTPRPVTAPDSLFERWTNVEYLIDLYRSFMERTLYPGDTFPTVCPNLGPDFLGATFGTDIIFETDTSYSVPIIHDWTEHLEFSQDNQWWRMMVDMTEAFVEDAQGDYVVGITDLHPGMDGVVSLRGAQDTCLDMYDNPERAVALAKKLFEAYKYQLAKLHEITEKNGTGCTNWSGIWHPDLWYITSCDFICMISEDMFEDYIAPLIAEEAKMLGGRTIFHLDGPGALKHLDALLDIPEIAGIQWVYGAGQPSAMHWLDVLKKIQARGKLIQVNVLPEDIPVLAEELEPEGLFLNCDFTPTAQQAEDIIKLVTRK